jgi:hypothetical protein
MSRVYAKFAVAKDCQISPRADATEVDTARALGESLGGQWHQIYAGDNEVFRSGDRIAKVPRHPDGPARLANGLRCATTLATNGVPVLHPLEEELVLTGAGPVSLWPYVENRPQNPDSCSKEYANALGEALGQLSLVPPDAPCSWEPFERLQRRLAEYHSPLTSSMREVVEHVRNYTKLAPPPQWQWAHGDISVANTLMNEQGEVLLIDLDSSGPRPPGWDMACLWVHLVLENKNQVVYDEALSSATAVGGHVPDLAQLVDLALIKATMSTSFLFTMGSPAKHHDVIAARIEVLHRWVRGEVPSTLPTMATEPPRSTVAG